MSTYVYVTAAARLAASVQALSQSAVPWMAPEVLQAGEIDRGFCWPKSWNCREKANGQYLLYEIDFFVTDDGSRSVACLFLGGTPGFRCASEGLLPSTSSDIWSLGCLMVWWPQSDCVGLRLPGVDWSVLKRSGIWNRRWLGFLDLWSRSGGQVMVDGARSSGWISWPL